MKDVHAPVPGTCECTDLYCKRDFAYWLSRGSWNREIIPDYLDGSNVIRRILKQMEQRGRRVKEGDVTMQADVRFKACSPWRRGTGPREEVKTPSASYKVWGYEFSPRVDALLVQWNLLPTSDLSNGKLIPLEHLCVFYKMGMKKYETQKGNTNIQWKNVNNRLIAWYGLRTH